jgi:DNA-binding FrmR family transcriptional regulator
MKKNMQKSVKKKVLNRMNYLIGHLEGVKKMIENDEYCVDIILQNEAVISALKKVNEMILENHLNTCVTEAIKNKNEKERKKKIKELLDLFKNK